jgi:hypothetical protein
MRNVDLAKIIKQKKTLVPGALQSAHVLFSSVDEILFKRRLSRLFSKVSGSVGISATSGFRLEASISLMELIISSTR